ncbi:LysR substrate-binding domain-containing protein [Pantoea sp. App145]|uniref:LysR substrate-binding domain-containing protein n=1 Tax=Pantoea sp. App145 TaxID=3071567 RepID=UPI003A803AD6
MQEFKELLSQNPYNVNLDIELLRTFLTIAESSSFSTAGAKLNKTQPAISQQMQRLEHQLGLSLFDKNGRTKRLSIHGQKLLQHAYQLLAIHDETIRSVYNSSITGHLRIGAPFDVSDTILPMLLSHIVKAAPNIDIEIKIEHSAMLMDALHRGEIDMIISTREDDKLEGGILKTSPIVWFCSEHYRYDRRMPLPLILADGPGLFAKFALKALEEHRIPWRQAFLSSNLIAIKSAIHAGLGVTARGIEALSPDMRILSEKDGLPPLPQISYYLWIRPRAVNPFVRQAYNILRNSFEIDEIRNG